METLFKKIDDLLCHYLGLSKEEVHPNAVRMVKEKLFVSNTSSFKRHLTQDSWNNFERLSIQKASPEEKEQLGLAVGKVIAKKLVVSFEEPVVGEIHHGQK